MNPGDKRLAMQVEDHPYDYKDFEGIIPSGNYGAGTVMVWDTGTYEPLAETKGTKTDQDKTLQKELKAGSLKIVLNGKKLKGEFALVKTHGMGEKSWLLIKHRDDFATNEDITKKDKSVISKKTLEQIAGNPAVREWKSNRPETAGTKSKSTAKTPAKVVAKTAVKTPVKATAATAVKAPAKATAAPGRSGTVKKPASNAKPASSSGKPLLNPTDDEQTITIKGHELTFTHLNKVYWPKEKITKREMLNYYYAVAPYILPYLADRPQSLNRHPNGITGKSFYQKDVKGKVPEWIKTFPYHTAEDPQEKEFLVCTDEASLLYMASLGVIEINPWSSRVKSPDQPDWCIIDLDPDKKTPFDKVIEAAQTTHEVLDAAGISSFCKTSGSTGLHIYIPLGAKYTYEQSKDFAHLIVNIVQAQIPSFTTTERMLSGRKGKMYLDFLQNRPQATIAAPYSVRPKPGATVSAPLHWDEVKKGLKMQDFTMSTIFERIKSEGDLFKPVLGKGIDMQKALQKLEKLMPENA